MKIGQQARRQATVFGFFTDQQRRGADGQLVQLLRGGAVVQAGDGAGGHAHRVHRVQALAATLHRAHDLVQIHQFGSAVALGDAHGVGRGRRGQKELAFLLGGCAGFGAHGVFLLA
jgi:hypothetical protein